MRQGRGADDLLERRAQARPKGTAQRRTRAAVSRRPSHAGRALAEAAESWARSKGCRQMASDAELRNEVSHRAHAAIGYEETARLVPFKKDLE